MADQSAVFGQWDEFGRWQQIGKAGALPSDQRFQTDQAAVGQRDPWLVVQQQFVCVPGAAQSRFRFQRRQRRGVQVRGRTDSRRERFPLARYMAISAFLIRVSASRLSSGRR